MKIKRNKTFKKILLFYKISHGIKPPFHLLLDGSFLHAAQNFHFAIAEQLPKILQTGDVRIFVTQCVLNELASLGEDFAGTLALARAFPVKKCGHRAPEPAEACLKSMIGKLNKHRFFVCTQDKQVRQFFKTMGNVPLIHLNRSVPMLEGPSKVAVEKQSEAEGKKLHVPRLEKKKLMAPREEPHRATKKKKRQAATEPVAAPPKKKRRKTRAQQQQPSE